MQEEEPAEETKVDLPAQEKANNIVLVPLEQQPDLTPTEGQEPDTRAEAPPASPPATQGPHGKRPMNIITLEPASTSQITSEPPPNTPMSVVEEIQKSPARSTGSSASKVIHIPEYLGLVRHAHFRSQLTTCFIDVSGDSLFSLVCVCVCVCVSVRPSVRPSVSVLPHS